MKIAYVLDTFPSLTETFIAREIEALRHQGYDIKVFALQAGAGAYPIAAAPLSQRLLGAVERLGAGAARPHYFTQMGAAWWRQSRVTPELEGVQHIHAGWASHPAFIAWGAAQEAGLPWSFSGHARDLFVEGAALKEKLQAAQFAAVCTHAGQQWLQKEGPEFAAKVLYVPHGLDTAQYPFRAPRLDEGMRFLSVGRLVEKKGFWVLLDALCVLQWQGHPFRATIIGHGPLHQQLVARSNVLGLADQVTFTGAQSQAEVRQAMEQANCFVLPAIIARDGDRDGLPNVLLEAAAFGLPLVSTNTGGITDFLDDHTGRLCPPGNAEALAATLLEVFQNKSATLIMCQAARQRVEDQFNIERNVQQLAQAFAQGH